MSKNLGDFFHRSNFVRRHFQDPIFLKVLISNSQQVFKSTDPFLAKECIAA
jgi:hypothetical protein